jgi:hypothetical protein
VWPVGLFHREVVTQQKLMGLEMWYLLKNKKYYYVAKLLSGVFKCVLNVCNQHSSYLTRYKIHIISTIGTGAT